MEIRQLLPSDPIAEPVFAGLTVEYDARYGVNDELATTSADEFSPPAGAFLVVVDGGTTLAGGGYRRVTDGVCEVKRMWVDPGHRRRGLASMVLSALEDAARAAGYGRLLLETGPAQPEAAALYAARGYARIPVYGRYPDAIAFERSLLEPGR